MTKPVDKNKPIEEGESYEVFSDLAPPNGTGDNNKWKLQGEYVKVLESVVDDIEHNRSIDYLKTPASFSKHLQTYAVKEDDKDGKELLARRILELDEDGKEPVRFRKSIYKKTMLHLEGLLNAIGSNPSTDLAIKFSKAIKNILKK